MLRTRAAASVNTRSNEVGDSLVVNSTGLHLGQRPKCQAAQVPEMDPRQWVLKASGTVTERLPCIVS
ncbi:hypothetical protein PISMIDRAFT_182937 [Pisolithus microcarpus 441]|uniref:Uncharacterized protein n=1 Tax=Pisolithus microcarpus 441 TaxID=765257 RepID=A0A0D0A5M8_9AGAM|nr:hypothetical protein PISMIDRAFT_182937 [Pisolithus microcarpus 441]